MEMKIKRKQIIPCLFTLILFMPTIISKIPALNSIMSLLLNITVFLMLFTWVMRGFRCSNILKCIFLCFLVVMMSTIINQDNIISTGIVYSKMFAACYAIEWILKKETQKYEMLNVIKNIVAFYVIINLISMIFFPDGVIQLHQVENEYYKYTTAWWILGNKNSMFMWLYIANILAQIDLIDSDIKKRKIYNIILILLTFISALLSESSTTIIAIGVLSIFPIIQEFLIKTEKIFNLKTYIILYVIFTIILLTMTNVGIITFVASLFGKNTTFTGRVDAWSSALKLLQQSTLIGKGSLDTESLRNVLHGYAFVNAHNAFLQLGIEGGIILYSMVIVLGKTMIDKIKNIRIDIKVFIEWAFLALFIEMSFEALVDSSFFWMIFVIFGAICDLQSKGYE